LKNIFITGASSYLGENLVDKLSNHNVYALTNKKPIRKSKNLTPVKLKLDQLNSFFIDNKISTVIHLASNSKSKGEENIKNLIDVNVVLGNKILISTRNSPVNKIITSSSYLQNVTETPTNIYSITKQIFEDLLRNFSEKNGIRGCSIQFGDIYGENDSRNKLIPYLLTHENSEYVKLNSDGMGCFSPINISDATDLIIDEIESSKKLEFEVKIGFTKIITVKSFIDKFVSIRKKNFIPLFNETKVSKVVANNFIGQYFLPKINLQEGLKNL
jgi:nucleoside-diphosphate-sugar epimerase